MNKNTLKTLIKSIFFESVEVYDEDHIFSLINTTHPKINIEYNEGDYKDGWKKKLPFKYGELPLYINPSDNMPWDVIIAPDSDYNQPGLKVAGIVRYRNGNGNDKIILGFNGLTTDHDKEILINYFKNFKKFDLPEFFDNKSKVEEDKNSSTDKGWEDSIFKQYKLTRVKDNDYVGMGVGEVARKHFYGTYDQKENRRK